MSALITNVLTGSSLLGINLLSPSASSYAITDASGNVLIQPDTMAVFDYEYEETISDYPIEEGAFNSYNKVRLPRRIRVEMACGGLNWVQQLEQTLDQTINSALGTNFGQGMTRAQFLEACDAAVESLDLFTIVTPDITYPSFNPTSVRYSRNRNNGAGMILATMVFEEVIPSLSGSQSGNPVVISNDPAASNPVAYGTTATTYPLATQTSWIQNGGTDQGFH